MGENEKVSLSFAGVKRLVAQPTKSGKLPSERDIIQFMALCVARRLNPFTGDAYLVGYDSQDGPSFSLITAIQAFYKRAEASPDFDGMESGIVIEIDDGEGSVMQQEIPGTIVPAKGKLVGGWCSIFRKDWGRPIYECVPLSVYNTGRSRWKKDPGGMIKKVAEAAAYRRAFPNETGGMYEAGEFERIQREGDRVDQQQDKPKTLDDLTQQDTTFGEFVEESVAAGPGKAVSKSVVDAVELTRPGDGLTDAEKEEILRQEQQLFDKGQPHHDDQS